VCDRVTAFDADPIDGRGQAPSACSKCGSVRLEPGATRRRARLYLHTELLTREERVYARGWDLERLATRLRISQHVLFERSLRIGVGVAADELAARMGACDVHLLPFDGGGWELTVLETAACGVANVITGFGAPPEYAAPFSELVSPAVRLWGPPGVRGLIDVGGAIEALLRLVERPDYRRRLAQEGPRVAKAHSWTIVGEQWDRLLEAVATGAEGSAVR
jgi:glycosyltransferase involved in cell wall biosynthesis